MLYGFRVQPHSGALDQRLDGDGYTSSAKAIPTPIVLHLYRIV
jgi:hypothetical protein